jgi:hypothetical protein
MSKLLVAIILLFPSFAIAGDVDRLVSLLGIDQMVEKAVTDCRMAAEKSMNSDDVLEAYGKQLEITPKHDAWNELETMFEGFMATACNYVSVEEVKDVWRRAYKKEFTQPEIAKLVDFYSSPLGKKMIKMDLKANAQFQELVKDRYAEGYKEARRKFMCLVARFARKLEAEKHNNANPADADSR